MSKRLTSETLLRAERHRLIADTARDAHTVRVRGLSIALGVSEPTIRRDLADMEAAGTIRRVYGGAVIAGERTPFPERQTEFADEKQLIASAVADLIQPGERVVLDIGTTVLAVAEALRDVNDLVVVTNSMSAATALGRERGTVIMLGGRLNGGTELAVVGPEAVEMLRSLHVDRAVLSCAGVHLSRGFVYYDLAEVEVRRAMLESARNVVIAADLHKFGEDSLVSLGPLDIADVVVTNAAPPSTFTEEFARLGVKLVVANEPPDDR